MSRSNQENEGGLTWNFRTQLFLYLVDEGTGRLRGSSPEDQAVTWIRETGEQLRVYQLKQYWIDHKA